MDILQALEAQVVNSSLALVSARRGGGDVRRAQSTQRCLLRQKHTHWFKVSTEAGASIFNAYGGARCLGPKILRQRQLCCAHQPQKRCKEAATLQRSSKYHIYDSAFSDTQPLTPESSATPSTCGRHRFIIRRLDTEGEDTKQPAS